MVGELRYNLYAAASFVEEFFGRDGIVIMSRKKSSREQVENGLIVMGRGWYIGGICIVLGAVGSGYLKS